VANKKNYNTALMSGDREGIKGIANITSGQDKNLSIQAKGIMNYLLTKPPGWKGQVWDIINNNRTGETAIRIAIRELVEARYMELKSFPRKDDGRFQGKYYVFYGSPRKQKKVYVMPTIEKVTEKTNLTRNYSEP
jgi:hypothetical protein